MKDHKDIDYIRISSDISNGIPRKNTQEVLMKFPMKYNVSSSVDSKLYGNKSVMNVVGNYMLQCKYTWKLYWCDCHNTSKTHGEL